MHRSNPKVFRGKGPTATAIAIAELSKERDALAAELLDWKRMRNEAMAVATSNRTRINELEVALLRVQRGLEDRDWADTRSEIIDFIINTVHASRAQSETPVSTLCAVCDQIKELHPASHPWTAKTTAQETSDEAAARASYLKTRACEHEWLAFTGADGLPAMNHDRCHKCGAVRGGFADDRGTVKSG